MVDGLVKGGVCSLPATVAGPTGEASSKSRGAEAAERQEDILNMTPGVKHDDGDEKQFTLPHFESLSVETTPGSRVDARIKLRLARLQLENGEREREREREFQLKLKRMELMRRPRSKCTSWNYSLAQFCLVRGCPLHL